MPWTEIMRNLNSLKEHVLNLLFILKKYYRGNICIPRVKPLNKSIYNLHNIYHKVVEVLIYFISRFALLSTKVEKAQRQEKKS